MDAGTALGIAGAMLGLLAVATACMALRAARSLRERTLIAESNLAALRRELERVSLSGIKTERRVKRAEEDAAEVAGRVDQFELRGASKSIDEAIDHARRGADPGRLTQQFGLSRGEADLVTRLHGRKKRA